MKLFFDYETYSEIDILKSGAYKYAEHESTEVLLCGYAIDDGEVKVWDATENPVPPKDLWDAAVSPNTTFIAANANFERRITTRFFPQWVMRPENTICTHVYAYQFAYTRGLEHQCAQAGVPHQKNPDGKRLLNIFCKPAPGNHKATRYTKSEKPEDWKKFIRYCADDVEATRSLYEHLIELDDFQQEMYILDQRINDKGLKVDVEMASNIVKHLAEVKTRLKARVAGVARSRDETLENAASHPQFAAWMQANFPNVQGTDKNAIMFTLEEEEVDPQQRFIMESRMQLTSTAAAKFKRILDMQVDGVVRGILQLNGAQRTGRWAGRGVQMQNIPGPYDLDVEQVAAEWKLTPDYWDLLFGDDTLKLAGKAVRPAFMSRPGTKFAIRDFSSVESRVAVGLCNDTYGKELTKNNICAYKSFASRQTGIPIQNITKEQRTNAKPAVLGCTYMLGAKGYITYVEKQWGKRVSYAQAEKDVMIWRSLYKDIAATWPILTEAYKRITESDPGTFLDLRDEIPTFGVTLERRHRWVIAWLPSGRGVWYKDPDIRKVKIGKGASAFEVMSFTYMGKIHGTQRWGRINTHGGGLLENIVQAIANDLLREWMLALDTLDDADILLHVHDEVLIETPHAEKVYKLMGEMVPGGPGHYAENWALDSEGYIVTRFTKG